MTTHKPHLLVPGAFAKIMSVRNVSKAGLLERKMIVVASTEARRLLGGAELGLVNRSVNFYTCCFLNNSGAVGKRAVHWHLVRDPNSHGDLPFTVCHDNSYADSLKFFVLFFLSACI